MSMHILPARGPAGPRPAPTGGSRAPGSRLPRTLAPGFAAQACLTSHNALGRAPKRGAAAPLTRATARIRLAPMQAAPRRPTRPLLPRPAAVPRGWQAAPGDGDDESDGFLAWLEPLSPRGPDAKPPPAGGAPPLAAPAALSDLAARLAPLLAAHGGDGMDAEGTGAGAAAAPAEASVPASLDAWAAEHLEPGDVLAPGQLLMRLMEAGGGAGGGAAEQRRRAAVLAAAAAAIAAAAASAGAVARQRAGPAFSDAAPAAAAAAADDNTQPALRPSPRALDLTRLAAAGGHVGCAPVAALARALLRECGVGGNGGGVDASAFEEAARGQLEMPAQEAAEALLELPSAGAVVGRLLALAAAAEGGQGAAALAGALGTAAPRLGLLEAGVVLAAVYA
ncbi:MAG: hypothetical protein J3K34DRAFT_527499, partial [Monoraphidium minutum]